MTGNFKDVSRGERKQKDLHCKSFLIRKNNIKCCQTTGQEYKLTNQRLKWELTVESIMLNVGVSLYMSYKATGMTLNNLMQLPS